MERYKWNFTYMAIGGLFFVFALITLLASVKEFKSWKEFKETAVPVAARITDIESYTDDDETKHRVFIEYEYEGERYSDKLSYYITGMKKGDLCGSRRSIVQPKPFCFAFGIVVGADACIRRHWRGAYGSRA